MKMPLYYPNVGVKLHFSLKMSVHMALDFVFSNLRVESTGVKNPILWMILRQTCTFPRLALS